MLCLHPLSLTSYPLPPSFPISRPLCLTHHTAQSPTEPLSYHSAIVSFITLTSSQSPSPTNCLTFFHSCCITFSGTSHFAVLIKNSCLFTLLPVLAGSSTTLPHCFIYFRLVCCLSNPDPLTPILPPGGSPPWPSHCFNMWKTMRWSKQISLTWSKHVLSMQKLFCLKIVAHTRWHVMTHLRLNGMQNQMKLFS